MNHHILHVLSDWFPKRDQQQWLLATIISTQGSSYRKAGAMMLFSDAGMQLGVVSGGCLESDLLHQARRCWESSSSRIVTYDMQEEGDIAWRLGLGCGGEVTLLLQPIQAANRYLMLPELLTSLCNQQSLYYHQRIQEGAPYASISSEPEQHSDMFSFYVAPPPTLAVLGGGVDAMPLVDMGIRLGWRVIVNDSRARYARRSDFQSATLTDDCAPSALANTSWLSQADAIIVMHHQVTMDAQALQSLATANPENLKYLALLGPSHRAERVLSEVALTEADLPVPLFAPAGVAIGGDLPESIALSMLAQAHSVLFDKSGQSLKGKPCQSA